MIRPARETRQSREGDRVLLGTQIVLREDPKSNVFSAAKGENEAVMGKKGGFEVTEARRTLAMSSRACSNSARAPGSSPLAPTKVGDSRTSTDFQTSHKRARASLCLRLNLRSFKWESFSVVHTSISFAHSLKSGWRDGRDGSSKGKKLAYTHAIV